MITAMSQALARIELMRSISPDSVHWEVFKKECMAKEKEQIIDAFVECWKMNMPDGYECKLSAKEYYNQTYNQKQHIIDIMESDENDGLY